MFCASETSEWNSENTDILDEHLLNDDDENDVITVPEIAKKCLKRKRGEEIFDEIIDERLNAYGQ